MEKYINILIESLEKKDIILSKLIELNEKQNQVIKERLIMEDFDKIVDEKSILIKELNQLDAGFQTVFDRVKKDLTENKEKFATEIQKLQQLIRVITDKSIAIETSEKRNKALVEQYFSYTRNNITKAHKSVKVASDYYKSMSQVNYVDPQLVDQKK